MERYDFAVVGAGFFGARLALLLARRGARVALIERGPTVCGRASWTNQARVHNGYHYPRSLSTANGSHRHYERFLREMDGCVDGSFTHLYAIARDGSATNAAQFERRCRELGLPLGAAPESLAGLFDPGRIEAVFTVREAAFDARSLRRRLEDALAATPAVTLMLRTTALRARLGAGAAVVETDRGEPPVRAGGVFLVAYAGTNRLLAASGLPPLDIKA
ncbi:MAG TPA: FAD-dependent oxidoreductase, partial [Geminicoccaceae bacterium]